MEKTPQAMKGLLLEKPPTAFMEALGMATQQEVGEEIVPKEPDNMHVELPFWQANNTVKL